MFVFIFRDNCSNQSSYVPTTPDPILLTTTPTPLSQSSPSSGIHKDRSQKESDLLLHSIFIPPICLALLANTLALVVLNRPLVRHKFGSIRLHLTLLSSAEVCLNSFLFAQMIIHLGMLTNGSQRPSIAHQVAKLAVDTVAEWNVGALVTTRNWCVALIALARFEAIWKPMGWRGGRHFYFQPNRVLRYFTAIVVVSYAWSLLRRFRHYALVCKDTGRVQRLRLLDAYPDFRVFDRYGYFAQQRAVPTVLVFTAAIAIAWVLLRKEGPTSHAAAGGANNRHQSRKAARMVAIIAVIFTAMEMPLFLAITLQFAGVPMDRVLFSKVLGIFNVGCIVIDSISNFVVYVLTSKRFKQEVVRLVRHCGRKQTRRYSSSAHISHPEFV